MGESQTFELKIRGSSHGKSVDELRRIIDFLKKARVTNNQIVVGIKKPDGKKVLILHIRDPLISLDEFQQTVIPRLVKKYGVSIA